jgi:hypothetical protein
MKIAPQIVSKAVQASFGKYDHLRKARGKFMAQMVGRFYNKSNSSKRRNDDQDRGASPLNLLHTAVTTLVPQLVSNEPRVKVSTDVIIYDDYAEMLGLGTNSLIKKIKLKNTQRKAIYDSIFLAGFVKTGLASSDELLTMDGTDIVIGQPYADRVDPDDMILDPWAREWEAQTYIGNRYRANLDDLEAVGLYDMDILKKLPKSHEVRGDAQRYASKLSGADPGEQYGEVQEFIDLCDVYFPREKIVVTLPYYDGGRAEDFLRVADYSGPDTGPYHMLGFTPVSDNLLPVAPVHIWADLHTMGNKIARKLARQADRLKSNILYAKEAQEEAEELSEADDGEMFGVTDPNNFKEVKYGGATPEAYQWMEWVKRTFAEQANNMDLLSGNGAGDETLGQSEIRQANTSVRLSDMQGLVYGFTEEVTRDLGFYLHTDPLIELPLVKRVMGVKTQVVYTPEMRAGEFFDYTFKIEPFSMARPDPNMAVRRKIEFASSVIPAAAQAAMLLGPGFRVGPFLKDIAKDVQIDGLEEWLDDPSIQQWILMRVQGAMMAGDPGKAGAMQNGMPAPTFNPQQPVPTAMGPTGGVSPATEQASAQQESSGEIQGARRGGQQSAKAMASQQG